MIFLDTEFNSFHGELISLAMVSDTLCEPFYEVLPLPKTIHPWVEEHVIPLLNKRPITKWQFQEKLWKWMTRHGSDVIVADWPEDIAHLMWWYCRANGECPRTTFDMKMIKSGDVRSEIPHNALSDAIALQKWYHGTGQ